MVNATLEAILKQAALDPPPGLTSNFAEPGGSHSIGYGITIATSIISTLAVFARLVSSGITKTFLLEDLLLVVALGVFAGNQWLTYDLSIYPGVWVHQWNVTNEFFITFLYKIHLGAVFYGPIALCIKAAILVNWLRIFVPAGVKNTTYWLLQGLLWVNVVFYVVTTFTEIFRCWPREKIWNSWFEGGTCMVNVEGQNIATSVLNFISDTTILAMPQWVIWHLHLSKKRKWGVSLLFVIGIGAWTFGVVRTVYFVRLLHSEDVTYLMSGVAIWTIWEITTGFLIMGIPAIPRIAKTFPMSDSVASFFRSLTGKSTGQSPIGSEEQGNHRPVHYSSKPKSRKKRGQWDITELETQDLVSPNDGGEAGSTMSHGSVELQSMTKGGTVTSHVQTV